MKQTISGELINKSYIINERKTEEVKETIFMHKSLSAYLDHNIIQEHAFKTRDGYSLHVCDLDPIEQDTLIAWMFRYDQMTTDLILDRMQDLINERIPFVEAIENVKNGLKPIHDAETGEVSWVRLAHNF